MTPATSSCGGPATHSPWGSEEVPLAGPLLLLPRKGQEGLRGGGVQLALPGPGPRSEQAAVDKGLRTQGPPLAQSQMQNSSKGSGVQVSSRPGAI